MAGKLAGMIKRSYPVCGYLIREVEWLMATYHISLKKAVWRIPRALIHLLIPAYAERQGQPAGMSRPDRASISARGKMRKMIEEQFDVVDAPLAEIGWKIGEPPQFIKDRFLTHG